MQNWVLSGLEKFAGLFPQGFTVVLVMGIAFDIPVEFNALVLLMIVDVTMGFLVALLKGKLRSAKLTDGLIKKAGIIMLLLALVIGDDLYHLEGVERFTGATIFAFCVGELISILEKAALLGIPVEKLYSRIIDRDYIERERVQYNRKQNNSDSQR